MSDKYFVTKNGLVVANTLIANSTIISFSNNISINSSSISVSNSFLSSLSLIINSQLILTSNSVSSPNQPLYIQNQGSGFGVNISALNGNTNILGNLSVTGQSVFNNTILLPGTGNNFIKNGTGDGASYTTYNLNFAAQNGIGFTTYDGSIHGFYDARNGIWDVLGGYNIATKQVIDSNRNFYATSVNATSVSTTTLNVTGNTNFSNLYSSSLTINGPVNLANSTSIVQLQGATYIANYNNISGNVPSFVGGTGGGLCITWNYSSGSGETDFWNQYTNSQQGSQFRFYGKTSSSAANLLFDLQGIGGTTLLNSSLNVNSNIIVANNITINGNENVTGTSTAGSYNSSSTISAADVISTSRAGAQFLAPGYMHYSDGTNYYLLLTGNNTPTTSFNGLRPLSINLSNGIVSLGSTTVNGTLGFNGNYISYTAGSYGAITIQGTKNGWSGINFINPGNGNLGTFMVSLDQTQQGFYSESSGNWLWGFYNGILNFGNVPESRINGISQSLTGSGYRQLPGGLILQWAYIGGSSSDQTWTFPIQFPNACVGVYGNVIFGGDNTRTFGTSAPTKSNVVCHARFTAGGGNVGNASEPFYVYAIGF